MGRLAFSIACLGALTLAAVPAHASAPGPNGKIAFVSNRAGNDEIYVMKPDGTGITRVTNDPKDDRYASLSPDGKKVVFSSNRAGNFEIYTANVDGTSVTRLTNNIFSDLHPTWSPDGAKIAFDTDRNGNTEIYTMNADGSSQTNRSNNAGFDQDPAWSPNGAKIAHESYRTGNFEIFSMNADGTGQTNLTNNPNPDEKPSWSPDGSKLAFTSERAVSPEEIYTMNADGTGVTRLTTNNSADFFPEWSPDGTKILFITGRDTNDELYLMNTDGTNQANHTSNVAMDSEAEWAPFRPSYDTPRSASPLSVSLVPGFRQTISSSQCQARGGLVSGHGPPLSFTSCNPPGFLPNTIARFGNQASGTAQVSAIEGNLTTTADEADVGFNVSLTDIRSGSATGADYDPNPSGSEATLVFRLRVSDLLNGASQQDPATTSDFDFDTPVNCVATGGAVGATCSVATTADALMSGAIKEGRGMAISLAVTRVEDSGSNGVRGDGDDRLFAQQGIFIR